MTSSRFSQRGSQVGRLCAQLLALLALLATPLGAFSDELPTEDDYYPISKFAIPESAFLEVGALELMQDGRLAVSSRRGDVYMVHQAKAADIGQAEFKLFANGLHEVLGLSERDGSLYATQRCEITRLVDNNDDGRADQFETVSDQWGINGDYHEYAFGSRFDDNDDLWVVLCLTGSGGAADESHFRGWCLRVKPDGTTVPTCSGIRSPGGIGLNAEGDVFYTDNQGPWNGTCGLKHLRVGSFQGNPSGNKYYSLTDAIGPRPEEPKSGSRIMTEFDRLPELEPTSVLFPYKKMGQSASGIACDESAGKFGPFTNQLFVGDQTQSTVMRVFMEKVEGHYQGACFPFRKGFGSGSLAVLISEDGQMFVGGTNRGWGSTGRAPYALERLDWTGKVPFEILKMEARPDGFLFTFTQPVDKATASNLASYKLGTYTYIYQSNYGSPEVDHTTPRLVSADVSDDGLRAYLKVDGLQRGHVHEAHLAGVRSAAGLPLLHSVGYYTLNFIPK